MESERKGPLNSRIRIVRRHATELDHPNEVEPTYMNHAFVTQVGSEMFLDVCVMPPDDLVQARIAEEERDVRLITVNRFVMSLAGFAQLHQQVSAMHDILIDKGLLPVEPVIRLDFSME
ncbi:MAG: hypothetical protein MUF01_15390 [Bryobacterales bacterium]|jgi:hypothetical protein|nr:hypothetical protein [Bryobacterales bacterium]